MNELKLVKPGEEHINAIHDYRQELLAHNSPFDGCSGLENFEDIAAWVRHCRLSEQEETKPNPAFVTATQFMLLREGQVLGMLALRHELNDFLAEVGGHIGYSVRPTQRRRGYAKTMLALALEECRKRGLARVLLTCDADNAASYKTIEACGGQFDGMIAKDGKDSRRYWIDIN